jgi:hypothetical protein
MGKLKLLVLAAVVAVVAIPDLRNKVLDQLFGSEEEFTYSGPGSTEV